MLLNVATPCFLIRNCKVYSCVVFLSLSKPPISYFTLNIACIFAPEIIARLQYSEVISTHFVSNV